LLGRKIRYRLALNMSRIRISYYRYMGVTIGTKCYISSGAHIDVALGKVTIGNHVRIASGSYILAHGRMMEDNLETKLGDNVIILVNAVVLPGVTVGKNSTIGAGSVVAKNVPPKAFKYIVCSPINLRNSFLVAMRKERKLCSSTISISPLRRNWRSAHI